MLKIYVIHVFLQSFPGDYETFRQQVEDLDRRLGAMICQGFDDCSGLEAVFKVRCCFNII